MKKNALIKLLVCFLLGVILCGVGTGVCVMEIFSLDVVNAGEEPSFTEKEYTLPSEGKLYIEGMDGFSSVSEDESLPQGTMKFVVEYTGKPYVEIFDICNMDLCENPIAEDSFDEEFDIDDEEFDGETIIRHRVNGIQAPSVMYGDEDWNEFRQMFEYLRKRKLYVPEHRRNLTVYINPADKDRLVFLFDSNNAWLENGGYYSESIAETPTSAETVTETTTAAVTVTETAAAATETTTKA